MKIGVWFFGNMSTAFGTTTRARSLVEVLGEKHEVSIIGDAGALGRIPVVRTLYRLLSLAATVPRKRFAVVVCESDFRFFSLFYPLFRLRGSKIVFDAHGIFSEEEHNWNPPAWRRWQKRLMERFIISRSDHVLAVSEYHGGFYRRYNRNVTIIPLFLDETLFQQGSDSRRRSPDGTRRVGLIGPFTRAENWISLRYVYDNLDRFDRRISFVIIGSCNRRIEDERVIYTGYVPTEEFVAQLQSLDAVLDYKEPVGGPYTKVVEAMACSLPVFTTPKALQGFDQATPGEDIIAYPKEELVDRINEMVFDDALMQRVGEKARATVEQHFSKAAVRDLLFDVVDSVVRK